VRVACVSLLQTEICDGVLNLNFSIPETGSSFFVMRFQVPLHVPHTIIGVNNLFVQRVTSISSAFGVLSFKPSVPNTLLAPLCFSVRFSFKERKKEKKKRKEKK